MNKLIQRIKRFRSRVEGWGFFLLPAEGNSIYYKRDYVSRQRFCNGKLYHILGFLFWLADTTTEESWKDVKLERPADNQKVWFYRGLGEVEAGTFDTGCKTVLSGISLGDIFRHSYGWTSIAGVTHWRPYTVDKPSAPVLTSSDVMEVAAILARG